MRSRLTSHYTTGNFCQSYSGRLGETCFLSVGLVVLVESCAHPRFVAGCGFMARSFSSCYEVFSGRIAGGPVIRLALYEFRSRFAKSL